MSKLEKPLDYSINSKQGWKNYFVIKQNPNITQQELSMKMKKKHNTISEQLVPFVKKGYIKKIRDGKNNRLVVTHICKCPLCGADVK